MADANDRSDREDSGRRFVRPWEQGALTEDPFRDPEDEAGSDEEDAGTAFVLTPEEIEPEVEADPDPNASAVADTGQDADPDQDAETGDADAVADASQDADADQDAETDDADADGDSSSDWLDELQGIVGEDDESDGLSGEAYSASTTREYQDLAEEIARSRDEQVEQQAVAATLAGVGSGLIGFDDVTGRQGLREEDVEHLEQERASDLTLRVVSAVILVGLLLVSMALGGIWLVSFVTVVLIVALGEFYATVRAQGHNPVALFGLLAGLLSVVAGYSGGPAVVGSLILLCLIATVLFLSLVRRSDPLGDGALTMLGVAWVSLLGLAGPIIAAERGRALVLLIVVIVAVLDMGAYFVGKAFGRRPLSPELSPNKTVEGLVGGIVAAFAVAAIASTLPLFEPVSLGGALVLAGAVSVMAPIGDAAESLIKRLLGVKDMGSVLPGHGGMLDRIDGILFSVPAAYLVYELLGYL